MSIIETPVNTPEAWSIRATAFEDSWAAAGWSEQGQEERFAAVHAALSPRDGESLLDYGCGTGAFADRVAADVRYSGFDWAAGMVERAAREHPGRVFTTQEPAGRFDLVAAIGVFNLRDGWTPQRTFHLLRHLWDTTGCRVLAASLYAGDDEQCISYGEDELNALGRGLIWNATVVRWRANDLLLVARR